MSITTELIEAKSRYLISEWSIDWGNPIILHGKEVDDVLFIKNFVPWAKIPVTGQTIFEWWMTELLANQISKEIDQQFLQGFIK